MFLLEQKKIVEAKPGNNINQFSLGEKLRAAENETGNSIYPVAEL